jgi:hypothetical protein
MLGRVENVAYSERIRGANSISRVRGHWNSERLVGQVLAVYLVTPRAKERRTLLQREGTY